MRGVRTSREVSRLRLVGANTVVTCSSRTLAVDLARHSV